MLFVIIYQFFFSPSGLIPCSLSPPASGSTDFIPVSNKSLTFPTGAVNGAQVSGDILILGDDIPEDTELFEFFAFATHPLDRFEGPTRATVIVQNDDISKLQCYSLVQKSVYVHVNYYMYVLCL